MSLGRRRRDSARATRLTAAAVLLGVALAAAWPATSPAGAVTTVTFQYTGAQQKFVVPAGVTSVHVLAVGGRGGNGLAPGGGAGGAPAEVSGDLQVLPGQTLYVEVGGTGTEASSATIARAFNGGDYGGQGKTGGGGASDVRLQPRPEPDTPASLFSRLIVAGGGGGGGAATEGGGGSSTPSPGSSASGTFLVLRPVVGRDNSITLVLDIPGRGAASATATATRLVTIRRHGRRVRRKVRVAFGTARATVTGIGALELTIKPSAAGRRALAASRRLPVSIAVSFASTGEKASTAKLNVTLTRR